MVDMELRGLLEWHEETDSAWSKRVQKFEQEVKQFSDAELNEEFDFGFSRNDLITDQHMELISVAELTDEFALVYVYSIFERFLFRIYGYVKAFGMAIPDAMKKRHGTPKTWLDVPGYAAVLKENGIVITHPPIEYGEITKMRHIRHAITHFGGWVTEENENDLKQYGFKVGVPISLADGYVEDCVGLVGVSCDQITKMCTPVFAAHMRKVGQIS